MINGADGFITKPFIFSELLSKMAVVKNGGVTVDPIALKKIIALTGVNKKQANHNLLLKSKVTKREQQVIDLLL